MINVYFIFEGQSINNCLLIYEAFMCQKRDLELFTTIKTLLERYFHTASTFSDLAFESYVFQLCDFKCFVYVCYSNKQKNLKVSKKMWQHCKFNSVHLPEASMLFYAHYVCTFLLVFHWLCF